MGGLDLYNRLMLFFFCSPSVFFFADAAVPVVFFAEIDLAVPAALGAAVAEALVLDTSFAAVFKLATSFWAWMVVHNRACLAYSS